MTKREEFFKLLLLHPELEGELKEILTQKEGKHNDRSTYPTNRP